MDIQIKRVAVKTSSPTLFALYTKIFIKSYHTTVADKETLMRMYQTCSAYIVYENAVPLGLLIFEDKGDYMKLNEFGVLPEFQRRGIGKQMMQTFLKKVKKEIRLHTNPCNSPAIIFYLKHGFEIANWEENYYQGKPWLLLRRKYRD